MLAPLNLDKSSRTSGVLPDGQTVPLAWDFTTSQIMAKVAPYFPWSLADNNKAAVKMANEQKGQYLADDDLFFRGVWIPAPTQVFDAAYSKKHRAELGSGNVSSFMLTAGSGGMQKVGSTVTDVDDEPEIDEPDEPEIEEPDEEASAEEPDESASHRTDYTAPKKRRSAAVVVVTKKKKKR